ncbi:MAG TPA: SpoIIE family protein phosphatase, partial [Candidatus Ozemobacteraceae bacterium]|nr:SpoIIE family protein phosphatase [Candidatus Ozemobacteraceae bacterium]
AAAFNPLKSLVGMLVDYLFGRRNFDSAAVIRHLLREMRRAETAETVCANLLRESAPVLGFGQAVVLLADGVRVSWPFDTPSVSVSFSSIPTDLTEKAEEIDSLLEIALESAAPCRPVLQAWQSAGFTLLYPIVREQSCVGLLLLSAKTSRLPYSEQERSLIGSIVNEIGPVLDNLHLVASLLERDRAAREVELTLRMYRQIQATNGCHSVGNWRLFLFSSLADTIKGDLIDLDPDSSPPFLCLCDAFHQGVPAALTLYIIRTALRSAPAEQRFLILHRLLRASSEPPLRAALTFAVFAADGLHFSCAGNPPPLLLAPGQPPRALVDPGSPLGLDEAPRLTTTLVAPGTGAIVCLATNGLWKAFGDDSGDGLRAFLAAQSGCSAHDLYQRLSQHLTITQTSATIQDDISFVLIQENSIP